MKSFNNAYRPQRVYQVNIFENVNIDKLNENSDHDYHRNVHHNEFDENWKNEQEYSNYDQKNYQNINFVMTTFQSVREHQCIRCNIIYSSRNLLFKHLRDQCWIKITSEDVIKQLQLKSCLTNHISANTVSFNKSFKTTITFIVVSNQFKKSTDYVFKNWRYAIIKLWLKFNSLMSKNSKKSEIENCCLNFDYSITLKDRDFMQRYLNDIMMMHKFASFLSIRRINDKMLRTFEYITVCICLNVIDFEQRSIIARMFAEIHLIDDLFANLLLIIDVLIFQKIILNFKNWLIRIDICSVIASIDVITKKNDVKRTVRIRKTFVISFNQTINILIIYQRFDENFLLLKDRDYLFEFQCSHHLNEQDDVYVHLIDFIFSFVQVHNTSSYFIELLKQVRLKTLMKYNQQKCYLVISDEATTIRFIHD